MAKNTLKRRWNKFEIRRKSLQEWMEKNYASIMIMPNRSLVAGNLDQTIISNIFQLSLSTTLCVIVLIFIPKCIKLVLITKAGWQFQDTSLHRKLDSIYICMKSVVALALSSYIVALQMNSARMGGRMAECDNKIIFITVIYWAIIYFWFKPLNVIGIIVYQFFLRVATIIICMHVCMYRCMYVCIGVC